MNISAQDLPTPDPAFRWIVDAWGAVLRCVPLEAIAQHAFTSRQPRLPFDSPHHAIPRLAQGRPGEPGRAQREAWAVAAQSVGTNPDRVMRVRQVHGRGVRVLLRGNVRVADAEVRPDGDAIVSNEPGLALSVSVADCVPMLIADVRSGTAAAVHAGWRGTCARVGAAAIDAMARECGAHAADCVVAIGPSIGPEDYTVGTELVDAFLAAGNSRPEVDGWFRRSGATLTLDLWSANRDQLVAAGVQPQRIFTCGLSTLANRDVFESFRAEGDKAGRMAGVIVVPQGQ